MSVKKVRISDLPQLPQESDASGIFMPAADENNRSYRVPLSRYDNAKNEAEKAAEGAMTAAQEANDAADRANDAAEKANDIVDNKIVVANSLSFGYRETGAVLAPPLSSRGKAADIGSLIYRLGKAYTIDTVLPSSGDLVQLLTSACNDLGDVTVQFSGCYTNGWKGFGDYLGIGSVHMVGGVPLAVVTDLAGDIGAKWLYNGSNWISMGGLGSASGEAGGVLTGTYPNPELKYSPTCRQTAVVYNEDDVGILDPSRIATFKSIINYMDSYGLVRHGNSFALPLAYNIFTSNINSTISDGVVTKAPRTRFYYVSVLANNYRVFVGICNCASSLSASLMVCVYGNNVLQSVLSLAFYEGGSSSEQVNASIKWTNDAEFISGNQFYGDSGTYKRAAAMSELSSPNPKQYALRIDYTYNVNNKSIDAAVEVIPGYIGSAEAAAALAETPEVTYDTQAPVIASDGALLLNGGIEAYERRVREEQALIDEALASGMTAEEFEMRILTLGKDGGESA